MVRGKQAETAEKKATTTRKTVAEKKAAAEAKEQEEVQEGVETENAADVSAEGVEDGGAANESAEGDQEMENAEGGEQELNESQQEVGQEEGAGEGEENAEGGEAKPERKPLTEEDIACINETLTTEKVKLSDDTEEFVFSYGPRRPLREGGLADVRLFICHLCRVASMQRAASIKAHLAGKRHTEKKKSVNAERFKKPFLLFYSRDADNKVKQFQIYPGENIETVTPEYEDRVVDRVEWETKPVEEDVQKLLAQDPIYEYNKGKPVLGLDYILKMRLKKKTKYFCVLCDEFIPSDVLYQHVTGIEHQATYVIKHFPKLYETVTNGLTVKGERKETCVRNIFRKLYRKIEIKHGFKKMIVVDGSHFQSVRPRYIAKVRRSPHYGEDTLEFTDAEVSVLIKKSNSNISFNEPDPPTMPVPGAAPQNRKRKATDAPEAPGNKTLRGDFNNADLSKWRQYKIVKDKRIERLKLLYRRYKKDPESHPEYKKQWSQFWHKRSEELKQENIDPETYNFKKEWLPQWDRRMRRFYTKDIQDRKAALRKRFGLPADGRRTPSPVTQMRGPNVRQMGNQRMMGPGPMMPNLNNLGPISLDALSNLASLLSSQQNANNIGGIDGFGGGGFGNVGIGNAGFNNVGGFNNDGPGPDRRRVRGARRGPRNAMQSPMQQRPQMRQQQTPQRPMQPMRQMQSQPAQPQRQQQAPQRQQQAPQRQQQAPQRQQQAPQRQQQAPQRQQAQQPQRQQKQPAQQQQQQAPQRQQRQPVQQQQQQPQQQTPRNKQAPPPRRGPVGVVSVLRTLTALEDQLGSLGPKSVQLLGKAVLCEKNKQTKQLLTDNDCYVLFATAKEKLKGQLMANVVDNTRLQAVSTAVEDLNKMINIMDRNQGSGGGGRGQNANNSFGGNDSFGSGNFRSSNNGGNMQSMGGGGGGYNDNYNRNPNMDNGNFNRGGNDGNFSNSSNFGGGNYRNDDFGSFQGGNQNGGGGGGGNYRSDYSGGNFSNPGNNSLSSFRGGNDSGSYNSGSGSFGARNGNSGLGYSSNTSQFGNSGNFGSNDNFNSKLSSLGGGSGGGGSYNNNSSQRGNWMAGSGSVYSNTGRSNVAPLLGGGDLSNKSSFSLSSNRNATSFGFDNPSGNFRRY